jgi:hypothetical protein
MPAANCRSVLLDQVVPDMVLADDVCRADGSVLLPAGIRLDASQLSRLRELGVRELEIAVATGSVSAVDEEAVRTRVRRLFRKSETDAVTQGLFKAVLEYRLEKHK